MNYDLLIERVMSTTQQKLIAKLGLEFIRLLEKAVTNPDRYAVFARMARSDALGIIAKYKRAISTDVYSAVSAAVSEEDTRLINTLTLGLGAKDFDTNYSKTIAAQAAQNLNSIIQRQNIALADHLADTWYEVTGEAILRQQMGDSLKDIMEDGIKKLTSEGLVTIDYTSQRKNTVEAALKRHIVSQANQAKNALLLKRLEEWEHDLVFVSAHFGARPSHAEWQGKVFSVSGTSDKYPPLVESTGYGTVTGLCGVNCKHDMTPYIEGLSELPDTEFKAEQAKYGMTSDEFYAATQKQRRYEREIRNTKRDIAHLQRSAQDATKERLKLGKQQEKLRELTKKHHMPRFYNREKPYAVFSKAEKQPRGLKREASGAVSGALTNKNDPDKKRRDEHAEIYYEAVRNRDRKLEIELVAQHSGMSEEDIETIFSHVFINEYELDDGYHRFYPNYDMAQSWARLRSGKNIQEHDIIMLEHEYMEYGLMQQGLNYNQAHEETEKYFNYAKACDEWKMRKYGHL